MLLGQYYVGNQSFYEFWIETLMPYLENNILQHSFLFSDSCLVVALVVMVVVVSPLLRCSLDITGLTRMLHLGTSF